MSKYTNGQMFEISHEEVSTGVSSILAYKEKLTILEVLPLTSMFIPNPPQTYKVQREFSTGTVKKVLLTERDIDGIVE